MAKDSFINLTPGLRLKVSSPAGTQEVRLDRISALALAAGLLRLVGEKSAPDHLAEFAKALPVETVEPVRTPTKVVRLRD